MGKWRSGSSPPKTVEAVIIFDPEMGVGEAYHAVSGWWWANTDYLDDPVPHRPNPTHWQPMPAPPTSKDQ